MREDEDLPAVCRRVRLDNVLEPLELLVVDGHLVARVLCGAEDGRAWRLKASEVGDVGGGALEHPRHKLGAPWPGRFAWECQAAQSDQARPEEAHAQSSGGAKGG
eukprot:scaffold65821_cov25-Phaeocystis_antarctica.AAC.1